MKRLLTLVLLAACCSTIQAQEGARIGVKAGYNSTWLFNKNVSDKNASLDYASSFGTTFGLQYISMLSDNYGFSAEVLISTQNQKYDGESGTGTDKTTFTAEDNLTYIDIPLMFRAGSEKGPYFEIGPQFSFLSGAKESFGMSPADSLTPSYSDRDVKEDFKGFGLGLVLGFGVDIKISDAWRLTPGLRFGYMFTDATVEYSESELGQREMEDKSSFNAGANHTTGSNYLTPNPPFGYEKSNRAFGGLHLALSYTFN